MSKWQFEKVLRGSVTHISYIYCTPVKCLNCNHNSFAFCLSCIMTYTLVMIGSSNTIKMHMNFFRVMHVKYFPPWGKKRQSALTLCSATRQHRPPRKGQQWKCKPDPGVTFQTVPCQTELYRSVETGQFPNDTVTQNVLYRLQKSSIDMLLFACGRFYRTLEIYIWCIIESLLWFSSLWSFWFLVPIW